MAGDRFEVARGIRKDGVEERAEAFEAACRQRARRHKKDPKHHPRPTVRELLLALRGLFEVGMDDTLAGEIFFRHFPSEPKEKPAPAHARADDIQALRGEVQIIREAMSEFFNRFPVQPPPGPREGE